MGFGSPEGVAQPLPEGDVRCRIDVVCAIGEDSRRQLERNLGASAHEGLVALAIREGRQQVRLSRPRPSGKENGRSSVGALRPRGSDGREPVLLPVPVGPPGVVDLPGARHHINFLRLLQNMTIVELSLDVHNEAHASSVWLERMVEERLHTNVGVQVS